MQITWEGEGMLKIVSDKNTILINPDKKQEATVVLNPKNKEDFKNLFYIENPGEYEINDDFFYVDLFKNENGESNLIYKLNIEGINILDLNRIDKKIELETSENGTSYENIIDNKVDVLIVPIGEGFLDAKEAIGLKNELSPKIVIAINYDLESEKDSKRLQELKSSFLAISEPQDKFKITKKNLPGTDDEIIFVVLNKSK